jgi:hypothetical protein
VVLGFTNLYRRLTSEACSPPSIHIGPKVEPADGWLAGWLFPTDLDFFYFFHFSDIDDFSFYNYEYVPNSNGPIL